MKRTFQTLSMEAEQKKIHTGCMLVSEWRGSAIASSLSTSFVNDYLQRNGSAANLAEIVLRLVEAQSVSQSCCSPRLDKLKGDKSSGQSFVAKLCHRPRRL